jgi:hypothetical protein
MRLAGLHTPIPSSCAHSKTFTYPHDHVHTRAGDIAQWDGALEQATAYGARYGIAYSFQIFTCILIQPDACYCVQFQLLVFAGAPIFIIMPMLIYLPIVWWYFRHSLGIFGTSTEAQSADRYRWLQKLSLHWEDRFAFAGLRWVAFIAFMAASTGIQSTPSPGIACSGTDFVQDTNFQCYTEALAGTHAIGTIVTALMCVVFPIYIYKNIRRISFNDLEEDGREALRFGPFFGAYRKGVWQFFFLEPLPDDRLDCSVEPFAH